MKKFLIISVAMMAVNVCLASVVSVRVENTVQDDEGIKIIANDGKTSEQQFYYIENKSKDFLRVKAAVEKAQISKSKLKLKLLNQGSETVVGVEK